MTLLQVDPTAAVARNADLVAWSRLGSSYSPADLVAALENRTLIELLALIRPSKDLALFRVEWAEWPGTGELRGWQRSLGDWVEANDACRRDILDRLVSSGRLTSRELPDTCVVPWTSTGWTNIQNVIKLLDFMVQRGEAATAGRKGRERLWDLAPRVYPDDPVVPTEEAQRIRRERRLYALGIARASGTFELNVMMPVMGRALLESLRLLTSASRLLADRCVDGLAADVERCRELAESSPLGRHPTQPVHRLRGRCQGGKKAVAEWTTIRQTVLDLGFVDRGELTLEQLDAALDVLAMTRPPR